MLRVKTDIGTTGVGLIGWVREAATAINALIYRNENPLDGDVRWISGALKRYDGATSTWINI